MLDTVRGQPTQVVRSVRMSRSPAAPEDRRLAGVKLISGLAFYAGSLVSAFHRLLVVNAPLAIYVWRRR